MLEVVLPSDMYSRLSFKQGRQLRNTIICRLFILLSSLLFAFLYFVIRGYLWIAYVVHSVLFIALGIVKKLDPLCLYVNAQFKKPPLPSYHPLFESLFILFTHTYTFSFLYLLSLIVSRLCILTGLFVAFSLMQDLSRENTEVILTILLS